MAQQTAVEWLALRYHHRQGYLSQDDIAEAKAMEKEQIIEARMELFIKQNKISYGLEYLHNIDDALELSEQYYNETYKTPKP